MKLLHTIAFILLVVGGLNWLLVAFDFNLVTYLVGSWPMVEKLVYVLVGLSAIVEVANHKVVCKACASSGSTM
jgi:hypothetical protein